MLEGISHHGFQIAHNADIKRICFIFSQNGIERTDSKVVFVIFPHSEQGSDKPFLSEWLFFDRKQHGFYGTELVVKIDSDRDALHRLQLIV